MALWVRSDKTDIGISVGTFFGRSVFWQTGGSYTLKDSGTESTVKLMATYAWSLIAPSEVTKWND